MYLTFNITIIITIICQIFIKREINSKRGCEWPIFKKWKKNWAISSVLFCWASNPFHLLMSYETIPIKHWMNAASLNWSNWAICANDGKSTCSIMTQEPGFWYAWIDITFLYKVLFKAIYFPQDQVPVIRCF